jgi:DNA-directed DNA polymerase III PolC
MTLSDIKPYSKLPFFGVILPSIEIPHAQKQVVGANSNCSNLEFLRELCRAGFKEKVATRVAKEDYKKYADQVNFELDTIETLGFTNYILMVWDFLNWAKSKNIPTGPGRGSVGSSLVSYLIGITAFDPVQNKLFFSRFLSKSRAKSKIVDGVKYIDGGLVPDIDCDFSYYRRDEVITYLSERYKNQTSKLLTTTTFTSKILIKDVLKSFENVNESEANMVSDMIEREFGIPEEIEDALSDDKEKQNEKFKQWSLNHAEACEIAMSLSGLSRSEGQHASAVLISHGQIEDLMPLQLSSSKEVVSGFDMYSAQELMIKMDILGLRTLDVVHEACQLANIDRDKIDIHHPSIYQYLQNFKLKYGVFQLETFAQGGAAAKIKPKNFEQLADCLAIARPGAFAYLDQYCKYVHEGVYTSVHPLIDDILKPTGGVCLFQEQYLAMLVRVGMTPDEAESARKVLGKKLKDKIPEVKAKIAEVCEKNSHPTEIVELLLKIAEESGGYSFNKSHSTAYAMISAWTIYLKANHPLEFYLALLKMSRHESNPHEIIEIIEKEMRNNGLKLMPPNLVKSSLEFAIEKEGIRFGLSSIRGISEKNAERMEKFRYEMVSMNDKMHVFQCMKNSGLNIGIGSALIQAGCLEGFDRYINKSTGNQYNSRSRLVLELCTWNILTDKEKTHCLKVNTLPEVNNDVLMAIKYLTDVAKDEKGKPIIKQSRFESIKKKYEPYRKIFDLNSRNEDIASFFYERKVLGYSYSFNLRELFSKLTQGLKSVKEVKGLFKEQNCRIIGFVSDVYSGKTKKGNREFKFKISDETGEMTYKIFNDKIDITEKQNGRLPEEDDIVIVNAKKMDEEVLFAERGIDGIYIGIQTAKIYMKLSDLKDSKANTES